MREGAAEAVERRLAGGGVGDELGDHGVVPRAHLVALAHARLDARIVGEAQAGEAAGGGEEARGHVLGVKAGLDRRDR
jgi:hypothetical protein